MSVLFETLGFMAIWWACGTASCCLYNFIGTDLDHDECFVVVVFWPLAILFLAIVGIAVATKAIADLCSR